MLQLLSSHTISDPQSPSAIFENLKSSGSCVYGTQNDNESISVSRFECATPLNSKISFEGAVLYPNSPFNCVAHANLYNNFGFVK